MSGIEQRGACRLLRTILIVAIVALSSGCGDDGGVGGGPPVDPGPQPTPSPTPDPPESAPLRSAPANIIVTGDVGRDDPTKAPRALGLLAENDVLVDPAAVPRVRNIQAAVMAATGGVRIPSEYRTPLRQPGQPYARSDSLTILGSIASHSSIALRWSWGSDWVGFGSRSYEWDPSLASYGPPYWPSPSRWQIIEQSEANADCYGASATMRGSAACR